MLYLPTTGIIAGNSESFKWRACLILVALHWPKRAWFSVLKQLAVEPPLFLPPQEDFLTGPSLATEEGILISKGFSERLIFTLLNSRKEETRWIYKKVSLVLQSLTGAPFEPLEGCLLKEITLKTVLSPSPSGTATREMTGPALHRKHIR